jgi:predicted Rossmann fold flavoprotein
MTKPKTHFDIVVIGAGAAGLMAAYTAGARGKSVALLEHTAKVGEKIRISGGGRCNFTNLGCTSANYLSQNPHFAKSALASFTQHDFIKMMETQGIAYHEKTLGQLFCDGSAKQVIHMLLDLCARHQVMVKTECAVTQVSKPDTFHLETTLGLLTCDALIVATGGLSIPPLGATDFGYRVAKQFGLKVIPTRPALVPLVVDERERALFTALSGVATPTIASYGNVRFAEDMLFTHRGLSGPAILQISSYLDRFKDVSITLDLSPHLDLSAYLLEGRLSKQTPANYLKAHLPNRFIDHCLPPEAFTRPMTDMKKEALLALAQKLQAFQVPIGGSEGYAKAEVTAGGVDTDGLSSKTMEAKQVPGLFFVGEVVDVTGWLGGYNFQWAWSSGAAAGRWC